jgi:hypothetical protein
MGDRRLHGPGSGTGDGCNLPIRSGSGRSATRELKSLMMQ